MLHRVVITWLSTCLFVPMIYLSQPSTAQAQTTSGFTSGEITTNSCWINAATGNRVPTFPPGYKPGLDDPNHSSIPGHGLNFVRLPDGNWINSGTGNPVPTFPPGYNPGLDDPNHSSIKGHGLNFVRVPCPPPKQRTKKQTTKKTRPAKQQPVTQAAPTTLPFSFGVGIGMGMGGHERCGIGIRCKDEK